MTSSGLLGLTVLLAAWVTLAVLAARWVRAHQKPRVYTPPQEKDLDMELIVKVTDLRGNLIYELEVDVDATHPDNRSAGRAAINMASSLIENGVL